MNRDTPPAAAGVLLLLALTAVTYSNHFHNSFHFDDSHTVSENVHIRNIDLGRFFTDVSTFSVLPTHQVYRPVVTTSLAIDYWLGNGLDPLMFHVSTFLWYSLLIVCVYLLLRHLLVGAPGVALFGAAIFALHPVSAETVNYVIQRAEIYVTLGVAAAVLLYARRPDWRRFGIYLLPFVLGALSKPTALVFPGILFLYAWLFDEGINDARAPKRAFVAALPALGVTVVLAVVLSKLTPRSFDAGGGERTAYWITQTWITLRSFGTFFWPSELSADTDLPLLTGFPAEAMAGAAFLAGLLALIFWAARRAETKPIAFGLAWFLLALLPTAIVPLAEVTNDHRLFFPSVGLAVAMASALHLVWPRFDRLGRRLAIAAGCLILAAASWATWQRNEVWRTEETLWLDVTRKSPGNGRGWMNYALTKMAKGDYQAALPSLERARKLNPNYSLVEINTAIALASVGRGPEAEAHFQRGLMLSPNAEASHFFYGRWLLQNRRYQEAIEHLKTSLAINPVGLAAYHLLMQAHFEQQNWSQLRPLAEAVLLLDPRDTTAKDYLAKVAGLESGLAHAQTMAVSAPTPERLIDLSLSYYRAGRFAQCVDAAQEAADLRPNSPEAWNNIAACHNALGHWDEGIRAAREAVRLNPASELARNNLDWAISQKRLTKQ